MLSGGNTETLNPNGFINDIDLARVATIYERLVTWNNNGAPTNQLAAAFSTKDAKTWKIKLRSDVVWHDGSPFTADDVAYSLRYISTPSNHAAGLTDLSSLKGAKYRRLDRHTVEIDLAEPNAIVPDILSSETLWIFKDGTRQFDRPVGTGPFMFKTWKRGQESLFARNPHYRQHGRPYLDAVEFISFSDPTAKYDALVGGQVDAIYNLDFKLVSSVRANSRLRVLHAPSAFWVPLTMSVNRPPFNDVRVREAFRLMADRKQLVRNVLLGQGTIGNDLFCPIDPDYAHGIPQRPYDPEKARALLKRAGKENLSVSLYTSAAYGGMLESATLFAGQAAKAGVAVKLDQVPADQYFTDQYLKAPFAQSGWSYRPLVSQITQSVLPTSVYNETHWNDPVFNKLIADVFRTRNRRRRHTLLVDAQRLLWDKGGYVIWGFFANVDAYRSNVHGLVPSKTKWLGYYDFRRVYLS
jgi:peptide/nickel transport system substrate-binding protein